jgi:DNA-binding transcriptional MerR regulator
MTTQPTVHPTTGLRRRALIAALGLAVATALLPAGTASASPQAPEAETHFTNPGGNPQPPEPPAWGPQDLANPTENPEPPLPPDPPDVPDRGPDDLANPTENPEPPHPPEDPDPAGDDSIPTHVAGGRAAGRRPVSIEIPAVGVDATVVPVGLLADRTMEVPAVDQAGWYEPGSRPGEAGPAVIVGHVDLTLSYNTVNMTPMEEPRWTLDELAERVDAALAVDYPGQSSGRVRDVPDRRAIRWYTTIGLVDRPVAHRGRTALYGPRHLLQLVAIKRLQTRGLPLVAIQQELAGATDTQLARVARVPAAAAPVPLPSADGGTRSTKSPARPATRAAARGMAAFWRQQPAAAAGAADPLRAVAAGPAEDAGSPFALAAAGPADGAPDHAAAGGIASLRGVRLGDGATLLLEPGRDLDAADLQAILDAARPLLDALRARGLDGPPGPNDPRREHR